MNIREWKTFKTKYLINWFINAVNRRTLKLKLKKRNTVANKEIVSDDLFDEKLKKLLRGGAPFLVARYGSTEATMMFQMLGKEYGAQKEINPKYFHNLRELSGFFPNDSSLLPKWMECMKETSKQVDMLCYWDTGYQEYLVEECCREDVVLTELDSLQPFWREHPWTGALKGKKVLVIHPFTETIQSQYKKRREIWKNEEILPDFELMTVKAVQTIAGAQDDRFDNWFEALEYMYQEGMKHDFDVAIISCGAYGMPLAAKLKAAGKQAIHWGGMAQIWFGIKGGRWDNNPRVNQFYNEHWTRPMASETPQRKDKVEGGCYW